MKIEKIIKLEKHEIDALRTLANINCSEIACHDCIFKAKKGVGGPCLLVAIRSMLISQEITW